jgi:hypothetical protein
MRFFDEDNNQFEWSLAAILLMVSIYIGSFCVIRVNVSFPCESEGCSYEGVEFPTGWVRALYRPMIIWDKRLSNVHYSGEVDETKF